VACARRIRPATSASQRHCRLPWGAGEGRRASTCFQAGAGMGLGEGVEHGPQRGQGGVDHLKTGVEEAEGIRLSVLRQSERVTQELVSTA
jgi:hypothetical protein